MNRERNGKLLKVAGFRVLKRPDGGVVTQRTANPLTLADSRDSWASSRFVPANSFQELRRSGANTGGSR
jgi:hypothetical protein